MKWRRNLSIFILFFLTLVLSAIAPVFSVTPPSSPALQLTIEAQKLYQSGEFEAAAIRWKEAADFYARIGDREGMNTSLVNQAEALQNLGRYPLACDALLQVFEVETNCTSLIERHQVDSPNLDFLFHPLDKQPESLLKAIALRGLGDVLQKLGDLELSTQVLQLSLKVAQNLPSPPAESSALLSLGNVEKSKGYREEQNSPSVEAIPLTCPRASYSNAKAYYQRAAEYYQQAAQKSVVSATKNQAKINYFSVLLALQEWTKIQIWQQVQDEINNLPTNRITIAAQINFAHNAMCLRQVNPTVAPSWQEIAQLLATSAKQAEKNGNLRAQSYGLGYLGRVYELTQNFTDAQNLTSQALRLAKQATAADMAYQWQWQLGRLGEKQGKIEDARAFYTEAFYTIESLRDDLVGMENPDIYFSFRDSIEPVYRQLVKLLLQSQLPNQNDLEFARNIIQSLNIAELEKFLRCSLVENNTKQLDEIINQQSQTAAIYPIILDNRLEIILKLPNQDLIHRWTDLPSREKIESTLEQLFIALNQPGDVETYILPLSQTVYDWLIKPIKADLNKIDTLVFVLDSDLRKIPLATLYDSDRQQFLVEQYATAVVPNSQILLSKSKQFNQVLMAGLTASRDLTRKQQTFKFLALNHIKSELQQIQTTLQQLKVDSTILIDDKFKSENFQNQLNSSDYNIIHLATHGNFSFDPKLTFILTASPEPLDVNQLQEILLIRSQTRSQEISLLVLSACQTAQGDKRASLGLAGVAIKSGARSTLGTLWQVDDASTSILMSRFYQELALNKVTKAVALQQAQLSLLKQGGNQQHPYYWSPYILVGNWL
ncbi:MAG TPA: CHAT domain-containing protein [Cyanobacteria bacterium UBA11369]|nr:CHAT domain-containing protein [Cyanobacteria bacterium UBA11371]HBE36338.1 CHAT domain-containing protein [Cyanobacteria bacterium UBA11368]HBE51024.1 CHAT domain-containing protein [Cyanobacteria bacterium UBA11369]